MSETNSRVAELFQKYLSHTATAEERLEFLDYVEDPLYAEEINTLLDEAFGSQDKADGLSKKARNRILNQIFGRDALARPKKVYALWPRIAAAASILLFLFLGGQYFFKKPVKIATQAKNKLQIIVPGGNKAILTLSNGKKIVLSAAGNNQFGKQGNSSVSKTANGQLIYTVSAGVGAKSNDLVYNTITTPVGGQYRIVLSDGTKVFLNAASSLRYPVAFSGNERKVELKGEAYFEVVHNGAIPFRVVTNNQVTEDIGTKFNINAYGEDAQIKTTLVEGAVKISTQKHDVVLKPGQQAQVTNNDIKQAIKTIPDANVEEAIAWTNGMFEFNNSDIKQVMISAARWYDFKVNYENEIPNLKITGTISRNVNFSGLIDLLKFEGIRFKIQGKIVTILN